MAKKKKIIKTPKNIVEKGKKVKKKGRDMTQLCHKNH